MMTYVAYIYNIFYVWYDAPETSGVEGRQARDQRPRRLPQTHRRGRGGALAQQQPHGLLTERGVASAFFLERGRRRPLSPVQRQQRSQHQQGPMRVPHAR